MKSYIIIPARMDSRRLPGKPMINVNGKPLVHWTYDRAKQSKANTVVIATSDREIYSYCNNYKLEYNSTRQNHFTGTHRCAEVLEAIEHAAVTTGTDNEKRIIVNWQCDEPRVNPEDVDKLIDAIEQHYDIATLVAPAYPIQDVDVTKVVVGHNGIAHWFDRLPMTGAKAHIGVYAFRAETLRKLGKLKPTKLSLEASLEQLAFIEAGYNIGTVGTKEFPLSINSQQDLDRFEDLIGKEH